MNTVGEPDEGIPHVRFDEGRLEPEFRGQGDLPTGGEPPETARRPTGATAPAAYSTEASRSNG